MVRGVHFLLPLTFCDSLCFPSGIGPTVLRTWCVPLSIRSSPHTSRRMGGHLMLPMSRCAFVLSWEFSSR